MNFMCRYLVSGSYSFATVPEVDLMIQRYKSLDKTRENLSAQKESKDCECVKRNFQNFKVVVEVLTCPNPHRSQHVADAPFYHNLPHAKSSM